VGEQRRRLRGGALQARHQLRRPRAERRRQRRVKVQQVVEGRVNGEGARERRGAQALPVGEGRPRVGKAEEEGGEAALRGEAA